MSEVLHITHFMDRLHRDGRAALMVDGDIVFVQECRVNFVDAAGVWCPIRSIPVEVVSWHVWVRGFDCRTRKLVERTFHNVVGVLPAAHVYLLGPMDVAFRFVTSKEKENMNKAFFMVAQATPGLTSGGSLVSNKRYESYDEAQREAEKLATSVPSNEFVVLKAVSVSRAPKAITSRLETEGREY